MADRFELEAYLARIGFDGVPQPDLASLTALHTAHTGSIPFEALDPWLGRPVKLDLASLQAKLVDGRRGGYCYEQNGVLKAALETIGFQVIGLAGRVRWMSLPGSPLGPRTHMMLKVELPEGPYLVDVGFGVCMLDAPLRLQTDIEQRTGLGTYRMTNLDGRYQLSARRGDGWRAMFVFDLEPQLPSDYDLGSWFTATNAAAPFTKTLILERLSHERRHRLVNAQLTEEGRDGVVLSDRTLTHAEDLGQVLDEVFGVTPPAPVEEIFARITTSSS